MAFSAVIAFDWAATLQEFPKEARVNPRLNGRELIGRFRSNA
jgi:hypothetical protein